MKKTSAIQDIIGVIQQTLDASGQDPATHYVAFDVDGTLWRGDLGEIAFARGFQSGLIHEDKVEETFWKWAAPYALDVEMGFENAIARIVEEEKSKEWMKRCESLDIPTKKALEALYQMQAWIFAGNAPGELEAFGQKMFIEELQSGVFDYVSILLENLGQLGMQKRIITASPHHIALGACTQLGFQPENVFGMEPTLDANGLCLPILNRSTYGEGKRQCIQEEIGVPPLVAFGDSITTGDAAMLESATLRIAVYPRGEHRRHALGHDGYIVLEDETS